MRSILHFLQRRNADRELAQEVLEHLAEKMDDLMSRGVPEAEARARAMREFGNVTRYREISREVWGWVWLETLWQDITYGVRQLRTNPGFTAVAVATLALGIAVNSSIFSVVSALLLNKPQASDPDHIAVVVATNKARARDRGRFSAIDAVAFRNSNRSFENLAVVDPYHEYNLTGGGAPENVTAIRASADYFHVLGVEASIGRTFVTGEDQPGHDHVAILSHALWERRYGSDPQIVGRNIELDGEKYAVVGVMPATFRQVAFLPRLWTPLVLSNQDVQPNARAHRTFLLFGRLKPGVLMTQARSEMEGLAKRAEAADPASEKGWSANAMTLQEYSVQEDEIRPALALLMSSVGLVLLIACANIANLLLARASKRAQEIAIRTALGAGRMRVMRQLLVESLLISLLGGGLGLVLSTWGIQVLRKALSFNEYVSMMALGIHLDYRVVVFALSVSFGAAILFGLAPAIRLSASDPQSTLRLGGRSGDLRRGWGRNVLVGAQIALAMVLMIGAGLLIKATMEDLGGDYGYDPKHVLKASISLSSARYHNDPARQMSFFKNVYERLNALPGVEAAAVSDNVPFETDTRSFNIEGQTAKPGVDAPRAFYFAVSPSAFKIFGIQLVKGRAFRESDNASAPRVAIVNQVFVDRFFPGSNPIGRRIQIDHSGNGLSEIIGIAGDIRVSYKPKQESAQIYEPYVQVPLEAKMWLTLRTAGDASLLAPTLRKAVWSIDRDQPVGDVQTIGAMLDQQQGGDYVFDVLLSIFGIMALLLASLGIYGVISYAVAQRTHEFGIRMALGASRRDIVGPVMSKGIMIALVSAGIGLLAAAPLPSIYTAMLMEFRVHSAVIFLGVPIPLLLVVLIAIYIPSARASRVDAMEALRYE